MIRPEPPFPSESPSSSRPPDDGSPRAIMSLNRVASLESFSFVPSEQRSRSGSDVSVRARKLSFNPLPDEWDPPQDRADNIQAVGAFEVPRWKRIRESLSLRRDPYAV